MRSARADKYREEAARLRREAEDMKHSENRQQLLDIAASTTGSRLQRSGRRYNKIKLCVKAQEPLS
jgi:hypothetical protein